jgi:predicted permease
LVVVPFVFLALAALDGLEGIARESGLLVAAMPTAVLVGLISLQFDLESEVASAAILATSRAAIPPLALVLRWL